MDIVAHGLWTGAAAKIVNQKKQKPLNLKWAVFWGVFPDLFAFTVLFSWFFLNLAFRNFDLASLPGPRPDLAAQLSTGGQKIFALTTYLYSVGHSLVVFAVFLFLIWSFKKRPIWELGGWLLHILIDIPTHKASFYPTPFLWPISNYKISGVSWATPWFMIINYGALALVYIYFVLKKKKSSPA